MEFVCRFQYMFGVNFICIAVISIMGLSLSCKIISTEMQFCSINYDPSGINEAAYMPKGWSVAHSMP